MTLIPEHIRNPPPLTDKQKEDVLAAMKRLWRNPELALEYGFKVPRADWEVVCEMVGVEYEKFLMCVHPEYANKGQDSAFAQRCRSFYTPGRSRRDEAAAGINNGGMSNPKTAAQTARMLGRPALTVEHKIHPPAPPLPPRDAEVPALPGDSGAVIAALEGPIGT